MTDPIVAALDDTVERLRAENAKLLAVVEAARKASDAQMAWITSEDSDAIDVPLKYKRDEALMELVAEVAALEALGE